MIEKIQEKYTGEINYFQIHGGWIPSVGEECWQGWDKTRPIVPVIIVHHSQLLQTWDAGQGGKYGQSKKYLGSVSRVY